MPEIKSGIGLRVAFRVKRNLYGSLFGPGIDLFISELLQALDEALAMRDGIGAEGNPP